jgi:hypothetical protein
MELLALLQLANLVKVPKSELPIIGGLDQFMEDEDWAIIFDRNGRVKGLYIPETASDNDEDVPEEIIEILERAGIDLEDDDDIIDPVIH